MKLALGCPKSECCCGKKIEIKNKVAAYLDTNVDD